MGGEWALRSHPAHHANILAFLSLLISSLIPKGVPQVFILFPRANAMTLSNDIVCSLVRIQVKSPTLSSISYLGFNLTPTPAKTHYLCYSSA